LIEVQISSELQIRLDSRPFCKLAQADVKLYTDGEDAIFSNKEKKVIFFSFFLTLSNKSLYIWV